MKPSSATSRDPGEIARFEALADEWWDADGPFRPLHLFNPVRLGFIRDQAAAHFGFDPETPRPLDGLTLVDIGCGGGLVAEPMTRMGAEVLGIDPSEKNIGIAETHAAAAALEIAYRATTAEQMAAEGTRFDIVLALEVLEHVADIDVFLDGATRLVAPGGMLIAATLNRTSKAYALAIIGAEYILGWVPRGTHDWNRFIKPDELIPRLEARAMKIETISGLVFSPLTRRWKVGTDTGVNYILSATPADNA